MKKNRLNWAAWCGCLAMTAALPPGTVWAQGDDAELPAFPTGQGARQVYTSDYFGRFSPRTALDMVRQIPGFSIEDAADARGLGRASGERHHNGQRITTKTNSIETQLGRIAAGDVTQIGIVDRSARIPKRQREASTRSAPISASVSGLVSYASSASISRSLAKTNGHPS